MAKAAVGLLKQNGIQVFVPSQDCCSMPLIMEGNQKTAEKRIQANLKTLGPCVREGYDIVCSCPTCGYFSGIDPLQRNDLSLKVKDMGEYLLSLHNSGKAAVTLRAPEQPLAYFAPCHQREQGTGQPYYQLISALPGADIKQVGSDMQCCGMGGHLGFKKNFHDHSLAIGRPVHGIENRSVRPENP